MSTAAVDRRIRRAADTKPSILLADSDVGTRRGFSLGLEDGGLRICFEVADADAALAAARWERPDVCLIDLHLPGGGLRALACISTELPGTPVVIMIGGEIGDDDLFEALRLGACGFLYKGMSTERLPYVLRSVLRGEAVIPRSLVGRVTQEFRARGGRRHVSLRDRPGVELTSREWEAVDLLRRRLSTRQIAERLVISPVTVRRHIASVVKKLQVDSRAAALELLEKS